MNFFDDESDGEVDESFFQQASPIRVGRADHDQSRDSIGDTTGSSNFRESSLFENRAREESVTLEEILAGGNEKGAVQLGTDVQELMKFWKNERGSPEVLHYPTTLMNRAMNHLVKKKEIIQKLNSIENQPEQYYSKLMIAATENMRADFTIKSYLRARLYKIEKYAQHLLEDLPDATNRLSPFELRLAQSLVVAWTDYMNAGVIENMPEKVQGLNDPGMIPIPDLSQAVFIRVIKNCGPVTLPDGEKMELTAGSQHMCRYSTIKHLLHQDLVLLI